MKISRTENYNIQAPLTTSDFAGKNKNSKGEGAKKAGIAALSLVSTVLPILAIRKSQGKCLNKDVFQKLSTKDKGKELWKSFSIDYGFKEMMLVGLSSIMGGVTGGILFDKDVNPKEKTKEGIHKALALSIPTALVAAGVTLLEKAKIKNPIFKALPVIFGVGVGMPVANKISNSINKNVFKEKNYKERKIKADDYLMHSDDIVSTLVLLKVPFVNTLQLDKILGLIYAHEGYEAGSTKGER